MKMNERPSMEELLDLARQETRNPGSHPLSLRRLQPGLQEKRHRPLVREESGAEERVICPICGGSGRLEERLFGLIYSLPCGNCEGTGIVDNLPECA